MEPELLVVVTAVALPFLTAGVTPFIHRALGERTGYVGAAVALASFGLLSTQLGRQGTVALPWVPSLDIAMRFFVDGWALLFALVASGIGVLVFAYSIRYMRNEPNLGRYYATLLAFMGSILGVALAADLIALFLFWELTSLCSFVLIGHYTEDPRSRSSARMAMLVTVGGGLALLVGVIVLALVSETALGTTTFDLTVILADAEAIRVALREAGLFVPVLILFTVAAAAKSAQVPLHFWLPNAMVAPTPVSAFLHSATMVKVGVYFIGRIRPLLLGDEWTLLVATLGLTTMTVGALLAVVSTDTKELLAYSTASHLGLMIAGFGFGIASGAEAGTFHLLNHALFKAPLFLVAGIIAHEAGTRHLDDIGGLWHSLPVTAAIAIVASLSMAGIPPMNGFYSKELLFEASYEVAHAAGGLAWAYPVVAVIASVFTVVYSLRFLAVFVGEHRAPVQTVHRPPVMLVVPPGVLAVGIVIVSVMPELAIDAIVQDAVTATAIGQPELRVGLPDHLSPPVAMSGVAIIGGFVMYRFAGRFGNLFESILRGPAPVSPSHWYDQAIWGTEATSARLGPFVHNGLVRTYVIWGIGTASIMALAGYAATSGSFPEVTLTGVPMVTSLVLGIAVLAGVALTMAPSHVAGVLILSILGFMLAIFFILASAPDLALTQLVVETLVLLIFLLVLEKLPSFYEDIEPIVIARDVILSVVVGAMAVVTVLLAIRGPSAEPTVIARYYATEAVPLGGGTNVVNVILVDFRGFDTLGELLVVAIAAISVLVLVSMRERGETK